MTNLTIIYVRYANSLKANNFTLATFYAKIYNITLKSLGGPERNPSEYYLELGHIH